MKRYDLEPCDGESSNCHARMVVDKLGDYVVYDDIKLLLKALEELNSWTDEQLEKALCNEEEILKDIINVRKEFNKCNG